MLGDKLGSETGKVTGTRVLPGTDARLMKIEVSFQASGTMLGTPHQDMGTFVMYERLPGIVYGEGQGYIGTQDGDGVIWTGFGVGKPTGKGLGVSWRAAVSYQTSSKKLARLNTVLGMVEFETDEAGNVRTTLTEWK